MTKIYEQYKQKLRSPQEAVKIVKSGDWVDYTTNVCFPPLLDAALAERRDELFDVKFRGNLTFGPIQVAECDPSREHFVYNTWHCSGYERALADRGLCNYIPMLFRNNSWYYENFLTVDVAMMAVPPMDRHGYFNLSCATGVAAAILKKARTVILEVNQHLPRIQGLFGECIHISEVDMVVEGEHAPLPEFPVGTASEEDKAIAAHLIPHIADGSTLQLGIGAMPNVVGAMLADSDIKDLGMHTELCGDAYMKLSEAGKLTNRQKSIYPGKGVTGIVFGSSALYDWVQDNPSVAAAPLSYVNDPAVIAQNSKMISVNNCIAIDLYGQISSESAGLRHISGTGGQLDYVTGAQAAPGGKAFICMTSSFVDKKGERHSRILPHFGGEIITTPRTQAFWVVTEQGAVNLAGASTWERAERLISVAHPEFRAELELAAKEQKIWR
ncbi:MAG: butyryl-CoA:acetate CoA-transferase [Lachnospiraceae bacterium]|nr:butyryl-CoA:acetate CoA-transferase [Lachnospiraceae bacterium]